MMEPMEDTPTTVQIIVARCGGAAALAEGLPISAWAVYKWSRNGIPDEYWDHVMTLSGASVAEIYHANRLARSREGAEAAA